GRRYLPYAFTEPGVAMLSSMLRSERAVRMNILIMRSFIRLRELVASNRRIEVEGMKTPPPGKKRRIGFLIDDAARSQTATGALRADS
ncbi:MAG TPA: hypothetical protein VEF06_13120, partial [Bryobacteraceae bacterium]|nr:hypothetical protein [Bryobacteraceae bacterium]